MNGEHVLQAIINGKARKRYLPDDHKNQKGSNHVKEHLEYQFEQPDQLEFGMDQIINYNSFLDLFETSDKVM